MVPMSTANPVETDGAATHEDELARLRLELWTARDAAQGAIAEAGALRAKTAELEALIHQLRSELSLLSTLEDSKTYKAGRLVTAPLRIARKAVR
jgi:hypothetical protein